MYIFISYNGVKMKAKYESKMRVTQPEENIHVEYCC